MRRLIVNTFFAVNLIGCTIGIPLTIASSYFGLEIQTMPWVMVLGLIELALLLPFIYIAGTSTKLPRRTYIPLLLSYLIPFSLLHLIPAPVEVALSCIYLGLAVYCLTERRKVSGHALGMIPAEFLNKETRSLRRLTPLVITFGIVIVLNVLSFGAIAISELAKEGLSNTLKIKTDGLHTKTRVFEKNGKKVIVLGMVHFAEREFYGRMFAKVPMFDSIVLLEGIKDRLQVTGRSAEQPETVLGLPNQMGIFNPNIKALRKCINADVDVSDVSDLAREDAKSDTEGSVLDSAFMSKKEKEHRELAKAQLEKERNESLMRHFDETSGKYGTVVIAWGAGHMNYISNALEERGYKLTEETEEKALSWW